jgi:hypothetical protein
MQNDTGKTLYLDLMKRCLTDLIYRQSYQEVANVDGVFGKHSVRILNKRGLRVFEPVVFDESVRAIGGDWPASAHTMIGLKRLDNLQFCVEDVIKNNVEGDLIETGVWRGGATILMRAILKAHSVTNRSVWVADSFEGLPRPDVTKCPEDNGDRHYTHKELAVSLEEVRSNFERYGLLDDQVRFLKGWFRDTLSQAPFKRLAVARLDGDMYESTMDALQALYPKISLGGYIIIDDFNAVAGCKSAVLDYRREHAITEEFMPIDWTAVYWKKTAAGAVN